MFKYQKFRWKSDIIYVRKIDDLWHFGHPPGEPLYLYMKTYLYLRYRITQQSIHLYYKMMHDERYALLTNICNENNFFFFFVLCSKSWKVPKEDFKSKMFLYEHFLFDVRNRIYNTMCHKKKLESCKNLVPSHFKIYIYGSLNSYITGLG